eukprot:SAG11_NODE_29572_length_309_cov_1.180952_1_plen_30_part_10
MTHGRVYKGQNTAVFMSGSVLWSGGIAKKT